MFVEVKNTCFIMNVKHELMNVVNLYKTILSEVTNLISVYSN